MARARPHVTTSRFGSGREIVSVGLDRGLWHDSYHELLTMPWRRFFALVFGGYLVVNLAFAEAYAALGDGIENARAGSLADAFFFSVQTLATIGYGGVAPSNLAANVVVTVESLIGLLGFALVAGIMFARFSRPVAQIVFSSRAIIAPYRGMTALMFRIVNQRTSEIVNMNATVLLSRRKSEGGDERQFSVLKLERDHVVFFPLSWTIVHPIDETSPLHGVTEAELRKCDTEVLILLDGFDETFSQTVHARSSYLADDIVWGARFESMFLTPQGKGPVSVDIRRIDHIERVTL